MVAELKQEIAELKNEIVRFLRAIFRYQWFENFVLQNHIKYTLEHSGCKCGNGTGTTTSHPGQTTSSTTNSGFTKSTTAKTPTSSGKLKWLDILYVASNYLLAVDSESEYRNNSRSIFLSLQVKYLFLEVYVLWAVKIVSKESKLM